MTGFVQRSRLRVVQILGVVAEPFVDAAITKRFLERKIEEYDALKAEVEALRDELGDDEE